MDELSGVNRLDTLRNLFVELEEQMRLEPAAELLVEKLGNVTAGAELHLGEEELFADLPTSVHVDNEFGRACDVPMMLHLLDCLLDPFLCRVLVLVVAVSDFDYLQGDVRRVGRQTI